MPGQGHDSERRVGRYRLTRLLGEGGMGQVWEAELEGPHGFRKPVAVKILRQGPTSDSRDALLREARLGAMLHHPNVVSTFELGEADGVWFVAMELVRGPSLSAVLSRGPLAGAAVLDLGVQCCAGLGHMHGLMTRELPNGVVHRDIKPANLLLDPSGLVKIADLGISALSGEVTGRAGTPGYMAPETWAETGRGDARSDLFALGVTLFGAATGRKLFPQGLAAREPIAAVERSLADGLLAPAEDAVPGLGAVLQRCLRADPEARWPSAVALGEALAALRGRQSGGVAIRALAGGDSGRVAKTPPPTTVAGAPGNLPRERDRFIGRAREVASVAERLRRDGGLVTLTGLGGSGKTRVALETLRVLQNGLPGGAWFVDLAAAASEGAMCFAVAQALSVQLTGADPVGQLGLALAARGPVALGLDNLEQLGATAADVVERWVTAAPEARVVCTSRTALRLRREHRVALGPLIASDALALFVDRAGEPSDPAAVAALVAALDGHSLSLELAAARCRVLPPAAILARLGDRLKVLTGGERDRPTRHQSLRASLDSSWELLSPANRAALAQLTVFVGGFSPSSAEAVLDLQAFPDAGWALDVLGELADASLVVVEPRTDRFSLQPVVASYAAEKLSGAERVETELRHARYFAQFGAPAALAALETFGGVARRQRLAAETANLLAACRRSAAGGHGAEAAACFRAAFAVLILSGPLEVARALAEGVLAVAELAPEERIQMRSDAGWLESIAGRNTSAHALLQAALHDAEGSGSLRQRAQVHGRLGMVCYRLGQSESSEEHYAVSLRLSAQAGDRHQQAIVLGSLGLARMRGGDTAGADARYEEALALHRELGNRVQEGMVLNNQAGLWVLSGRPDEARRLLESARVIHREVGSKMLDAIAIGTLAAIRYLQGHIEESQAAFEQALAGHRAAGDRQGEIALLNNLAAAETLLGRLGPATERAETALRLARETGAKPYEASALLRLGRIARLRGDLTAARSQLEASLALSRAATVRRQEGAALCELAELALAEGRLDTADALLKEAEALVRRVEAWMEWIVVRSAQARLAGALGDAEGRASALAEAAERCARVGAGPGSEPGRALEHAREQGLPLQAPGAGS